MSPPTQGRGADEDERPAKRSRVLVACQRCKSRRQKCDNAAPVCSNCARSSATCSYNSYPNSYVQQLEERVGQLEARLQSVDPSQASDHFTDNARTPQMDTPVSMPSQQQLRPVAPSSSGGLAYGIGLLSSCAAAEPHYFGFSSGLTLAHFVEAALASGSGDGAEVNLPSLADRPFSKQVPTAQTKAAHVPPHHTGSRYIKAYLAAIAPLYPFLDPDELWQIHGRAVEDTRSLSEPREACCADLARLHLVYAIGSRCTQLLKPRKVPKHVPEGHLLSAMQYLPEVLKVTSLHAIEVTLLLAIHSMRSPSGASVWHLCGLAMRQCLELGLHRPKPFAEARPEQYRRNLFWSVYIFERKSALVLGRPFAISDKDIETALPSESECNTHDSSTPTVAGAKAADTAGTPPVALHRQYILLYRIHGRIRSALHRLKRLPVDPKAGDKLTASLEMLEIWKSGAEEEMALRNASVPSLALPVSRSQSDSSDSGDDTSTPLARSSSLDRTELLLEYYKARRSLLQPLLTEAGQSCTPELADHAACADASGQICQLYRKLHRLSAMPFTLRDLHAVFIAGFTSIYCITARPSLYNARRAGDIGACSTVLYVIAEQWSSAKRYRDAFETVADKLVALVDAAQSVRSQPSAFTKDSNTRHSGDSISLDHQNREAPYTSAGRTAHDDRAPKGPGDLNTAFDNDEFAGGGVSNDPFDDPLSSFSMAYADAGLRELLANEGLDWFAESI